MSSCRWTCGCVSNSELRAHEDHDAEAAPNYLSSDQVYFAEHTGEVPRAGFVSTISPNVSSPELTAGDQVAVTLAEQLQETFASAVHYFSSEASRSTTNSRRPSFDGDDTIGNSPGQEFDSGIGSLQKSLSRQFSRLVAGDSAADEDDGRQDGHNGLTSIAKVFGYMRRLRTRVTRRLQPSVLEVDRGVHIERLYELYVPSKRSHSKMKLCERESVFHRRQSHRAQTFLAELNLVDSLPREMGKTGTDALSGSSDSEEDSGSNSGSEQNWGLPSGSPSVHPSVLRRGKSTVSVKSFTEPELVTHWAVFVAKLFHQKIEVQDFLSFSSNMLSRKTRAVAPRQLAILPSVLEKAKIVVRRAMNLSKRICKESEDELDGDWRTDGSLMIELFGTEYYDILTLLANSARRIVSVQPTLVEVAAPCKVFGDLHGQLRDLLLCFQAFGEPRTEGSLKKKGSPSSFVFNGDFVDRGAHQLEVVGVLLALKVVFPGRIFLIRGNHEDRAMSEKYGFKAECSRVLGAAYGQKLFNAIHNVFDQLPLAAVISKRVLVVHGGIGDGAWRLDDVRNLKRPMTTQFINDLPNRWVYNILWSDPIEEDEQDAGSIFGVHDSPRGESASTFGWNVTKTFCARNGLSLIIRSHQSKQDSLGFDIMHENLLIRIFTARDYEGHGNDGAILNINCAPKSWGADMLQVRPQVLRSVVKDTVVKDRREQPESPKEEKAKRRTSAEKGEAKAASFDKEMDMSSPGPQRRGRAFTAPAGKLSSVLVGQTLEASKQSKSSSSTSEKSTSKRSPSKTSPRSSRTPTVVSPQSRSPLLVSPQSSIISTSDTSFDCSDVGSLRQSGDTLGKKVKLKRQKSPSSDSSASASALSDGSSGSRNSDPAGACATHKNAEASKPGKVKPLALHKVKVNHLPLQEL